MKEKIINISRSYFTNGGREGQTCAYERERNRIGLLAFHTGMRRIKMYNAGKSFRIFHNGCEISLAPIASRVREREKARRERVCASVTLHMHPHTYCISLWLPYTHYVCTHARITRRPSLSLSLSLSLSRSII